MKYLILKDYPVMVVILTGQQAGVVTRRECKESLWEAGNDREHTGVFSCENSSSCRLMTMSMFSDVYYTSIKSFFLKKDYPESSYYLQINSNL